MVTRPPPALVALGLAALALGAWSWFRATGARPLPALARAAEPRSPETPLPRIALERLKQAQAGDAAEAGDSRDVFRFGRTPAPPDSPRSLPSVAPPVSPGDAGPPAPPPPATLPPFGVKYIGSVEQRGTKIAVLLSDDKKEVLTGREGDTVANRIKIVRIGFESVEIQDVGSDRIRRIPLKGN